MQKHASTSGRGPAMPIIEIGGKRLSDQVGAVIDIVTVAKIALRNDEALAESKCVLVASVLGMALEILHPIEDMANEMAARS